MALIADFVVETANSPGTSTTVSLTGAAGASFSTFASRFSTGSQIYYVISDEASMREIGIGTFTSGAPATITRTTVLANTLGTTARLNFIGPVLVYNDVPASKRLFLDANGNLATIAIGPIAPALMQQTGTSGWLNNYRADSGANAISLNQTVSGPDANAIAVNLRATTSFFAIWQLGGVTKGSIGTNGSIVQYNTTSDRRVKLVFGPAETGGIIDSVNVYEAAFIAKPQKSWPMFLADELQQHCPHAVTGEPDALDVLGNPIMQQVDHSSLVATLWNEAQALRRRVSEQESLVQTLLRRVAKLEKK